MGDLRDLFPRTEIPKPYGRLIRCEACGADVDIIEIQVRNATSSMDPGRCGQCITDPEPTVGRAA